MDSPATYGLHDQVASALEIESALHRGLIALSQLDGVDTVEKVGSMEKVHVEGVALDPLAAVKKAPQGGDPLINDDSAGVLHGVDGAHLIGHWADTADARGYVGRLGEVAAYEHRLEIARRLEDLEGNLTDDAVMHLYSEGAFTLDTRQTFDADCALA
jgi:hypothetical protein